MYRFLQKHGKKILAVFAAFLMVSFALTGYYGQGGAGSRNPVIARVGGEKIRQQDLYSAHQAWEILTRLINTDARPPQPLAYEFGPDIAEQITRHPMMFLLLQKEAQKMGVSYDPDYLNSLIENKAWLRSGDPDRDEAIRRAMAQFLIVGNAFGRAVSAVKVTEPMLQHQLATLGQTINVNVVEFTTAQYKDRVTAPTPPQLQAQFDKYADVVRGPGDESNPLGFGYKYPDRLKLQYIGVRRDDVRKFVQGTKDPYQWEVEAQKFYLQNPTSFVRRQPPQTQPTTQAATAPTTAPFAEVREQIKERLIDEAATRKMTEVVDRINTVMATDWQNYATAAGTATRPATAPATPLGAPYDSFEYLQKLAQRVQQQTGVLPIVVSIADRWLTQKDIEALPGLNQATVDELPLPQYLVNRAAGFLAPENRDEAGVLAELEPTRSIYDSNGNVYITRITAMQPAHRPASIAEVEAQVREDYAAARAYELARGDAQKLLEEARQAGDLKSAASGRNVVGIGPLTITQTSGSIPGVAVSGDSAARFLRETFKLLTSATTQPAATRPTTLATTNPAPKAMRLVELAADGRVFVAELGDVQAMWTERSLPFEQFQFAQLLTGQLGQSFQREWFNYDNVKARLGFVSEDPNAEH